MNNITLPRGIRNNNPGNIRLSKTRWQGQKNIQTDTSFVEFETPVMGIRALIKVLTTYFVKYNLNTVESIINRWAPPHENATDSYIFHVSRALNVKRRDVLNLNDKKTILTLTKAIVRHENGRPPHDMPRTWYDDTLYQHGYNLAFPTLSDAKEHIK